MESLPPWVDEFMAKHCPDFSEADFLLLGLAMIDQAGVRIKTQTEIDLVLSRNGEYERLELDL